MTLTEQLSNLGQGRAQRGKIKTHIEERYHRVSYHNLGGSPVASPVAT